MVPFVYLGIPQVAYNLMWPILDLQEEDEVTRDFAEGTSKKKTTYVKREEKSSNCIVFCYMVSGVTDPLKRKARLYPWYQSDESMETVYDPLSLIIYSDALMNRFVYSFIRLFVL
jgi:hypothetical protein